MRAGRPPKDGGLGALGPRVVTTIGDIVRGVNSVGARRDARKVARGTPQMTGRALGRADGYLCGSRVLWLAGVS